MADIIVQWRPGSRFENTAIDPNVLVQRIHQLVGEDDWVGNIDKLVEDAQNPVSPLYQVITHDVDMGMRKLWKFEIKKVIREIQLVAINGTPLTTPVRAFLNCKNESGKHEYVSIQRTYSDELAPQVIEQIYNRIQSTRDFASAWQQFGAVLQAVGLLNQALDLLKIEKDLKKATK